MPLSKHYGGKGAKVMRSMRKQYGKRAEEVFYKTENKMKKKGYTSHMPKGASQSPHGDIAPMRQRESVAAGGFSEGRTYTTPFSSSASGGVGGIKKAKDTYSSSRVVRKG